MTGPTQIWGGNLDYNRGYADGFDHYLDARSSSARHDNALALVLLSARLLTEAVLALRDDPSSNENMVTDAAEDLADDVIAWMGQ